MATTPAPSSESNRRVERITGLAIHAATFNDRQNSNRHGVGSTREDSALLHRVAERDQAAMALLYEKHSKLVYSVALRIVHDPHDAEDLTQEVFLQVWRSPAQILRDRPLAPYLAVVSRNRSIDLLRRRCPTETISEDICPGLCDFALHAEEVLLCESVWIQAEKLPAEQRSILAMAFQLGMSHSEIAQISGTPLGTVKTRVRNALQHLRRSAQLCVPIRST